jgi:hypothetical protein
MDAAMRWVLCPQMLRSLVHGDAELRFVPDAQVEDTLRRQDAPPDPSRFARGA